tara:strand:- start:160 stop:411 length:252 start_codon:yes stop_codon:yes gene_type:complete
MDDAAKVLKNEKIRTTDEFLVKKREPLVLPPDYNELPKPRQKNTKKDIDEKKKIKEMFKVSEKEIINSNNSSIEESIINKIRK